MGIFVAGKYMAIACWIEIYIVVYFTDVCNNIGSILKSIVDMQWDINVQCGNIFVEEPKPIMWNVCIPVFLVTLLIALRSYEVYIYIDKVALYLHIN